MGFSRIPVSCRIFLSLDIDGCWAGDDGAQHRGAHGGVQGDRPGQALQMGAGIMESFFFLFRTCIGKKRTSAWIRLDLAFLDPDPYPYPETGA